MSEFDPHISKQILTKAKDCSVYVVKETEIEHLNKKIKTPYKVLEGKQINNEHAAQLTKNIEKPIFESGTYVARYRSWTKLYYLLEEAEETQTGGLDNFFGLRKKMWDSALTTVSLVFAKNPFEKNVFDTKEGIKHLQPLDMDSYDSLLDYIDAASKFLILSPDIRIKGREKTITVDDYIKFVDHSIKVLSEFNKKPIFAPLQIHLSQRNLRKILVHYKKQKYTNIWVNFNANNIGGTYFSRLKTLHRHIDKIMGLENVTLYFSNIKKEINPHIKDEKVVGSDILSQFFAADFIGVNREPLRIIDENQDERINELIMKGEFESRKDYDDSLKYHKSRILDPESYYYYNIDKYPHKINIDKNLNLDDVQINKLVNSILIHSEVERTKNFVENKKIIKPYVKNKKALEETKIINDLPIEGETQSKILDFLGGL